LPELRQIALDLLARREHSAVELRRKLRRRGADETAAEAVVDRLIQDGWVDDRRYAESFIRSRLAKGFGPLRIDGELRARGVDSALVRTVVWEVGEQWKVRAETARRKRFSGDPPDDRTEWARQFRFLEYRGFTREQIRHILRRQCPDGEVDDD
jgi:regulatory protein